MSALALAAHQWGAEVGGSDRARSSYVERLEAAGIPVAVGHDAANVPADAEVIVSSAVAPDNPEVVDRTVRKCGELLAELGGNARAGGGWLVAEGDESDRTLELLHPRIAALTNVELDHHATFVSEDEVRELFERWLAAAPAQVRGDELEPASLELAVPGEHNRRNAAVALAALELAGVARAEAERVLPEFTGAGRRFELRGEAAGVRVF